MKESLKFIVNFIFILFLFAVLFSYAMFQGGFVSWFLFYSFLPIFIYQILLLIYPIHRWEVKRELSKNRLQAGGTITVEINLYRKFPFPLFYCVIEEVMPDSLNRIDNGQNKYFLLAKDKEWRVNRQVKKIVFPAIRRKMTVTYSLAQIPRGEHQLSQVRIRTGDVFGFVKKEITIDTESRIICYPNVLPIQLNEMKKSVSEGSKAAVRSHAHSNIAAGVREYTPGDRFSSIDWKQTARKNTMMTKEFEREEGTQLFLILDSCKEGLEHPLLYEATVELALTVIDHWKKIGRDVGFLSVGGKTETVNFSSLKEKGGENRIRRYLSTVEPTGNLPFSKRLKEEYQIVSQGSGLLFVTTKMDKNLVDVLRKLKLRNKQVRVLLIRWKRQANELIGEHVHELIKIGVDICILTEQELVGNPIEVNYYEASV